MEITRFCRLATWAAPVRRPRFISQAIQLARPVLFVVVALALAGTIVACYLDAASDVAIDSFDEFPQLTAIARVDLANLVTIGKNAYFNLEPGHRLCYTDGTLKRTVTVCRRTKMIDGVDTRVVQQKDERDGQSTRIVWRYYAIDKNSGALYCFGAHVQSYHQGQLLSQRGWRSGVHGALFTLVMPATPKVGDRLVRGPSQRVYEILDTDAKIVTPAGTFTNCLRLVAKETAGGEAVEKAFAPGVGLVQDGPFTLLKVVQTGEKTSITNTAD